MKLTLIGSTVVLATALTGCAGTGTDSGKVTITAGLYPLAWTAEQVGGDLATVTDLTPPGSEPHDLELSVKQTASVADADLLVIERGLQAQVDAAVDANATGTVLDVTATLPLKPVTETLGDSGIAASAGIGDGLDPHFWQDPMLVAELGDAIAADLGRIDPTHAATYTANADRLRTELTTLDQQYRTGLAQCRRDTIVVSHAAFGYLSTYGLTIAPILGLAPDSEPTPADLARLHKLIASDGITTVFSERLASKKAAETLAADTGVTSAVLDPIEGLDAADSGSDYLSLMRENLAALEKANDC